HQSGLPRIGSDIDTKTFEADLGVSWGDVYYQPGNEQPTKIDLVKIVTALLRQPAMSPLGYNNDAFYVASAVIEATTGKPYATWIRENLFADARFGDLAPRAVDGVRAARYYRLDAGSFAVGNHHPDYTDFTLAGGYYVSAAAVGEWVEALMTKEP